MKILSVSHVVSVNESLSSMKHKRRPPPPPPPNCESQWFPMMRWTSLETFFVRTKTVKIFFIIPSLVFHRRRKGIGIT